MNETVWCMMPETSVEIAMVNILVINHAASCAEERLERLRRGFGLSWLSLDSPITFVLEFEVAHLLKGGGGGTSLMQRAICGADDNHLESDKSVPRPNRHQWFSRLLTCAKSVGALQPVATPPPVTPLAILVCFDGNRFRHCAHCAHGMFRRNIPIGSKNSLTCIWLTPPLRRAFRAETL